MKLIKKSWDDITVGDFSKLQSLSTDNLLESSVSILSVLCDVNEDEILSLPKVEFDNLLNESAFINTQPVKKFDKYKFKINDVTYIFDPCFANFTVAQYADLTYYLNNKGSLNKVLSVFLIPKGMKYNEGYDIEKAYVDLNELPITYALGISDFFLYIYNVLLKAKMKAVILTLKKELKTTPKEKQAVLIDEITSLETLLKTIK